MRAYLATDAFLAARYAKTQEVVPKPLDRAAVKEITDDALRSDAATEGAVQIVNEAFEAAEDREYAVRTVTNFLRRGLKLGSRLQGPLKEGKTQGKALAKWLIRNETAILIALIVEPTLMIAAKAAIEVLKRLDLD